MTRRSDRYDTDLPAHVQAHPHARPEVGRIRNVSSQGLLLELLESSVQRESDVWVEIPKGASHRRVGLVGKVAWVADGRAGVVIEAMLPHHRERLGELVEALSTRTEH